MEGPFTRAWRATMISIDYKQSLLFSEVLHMIPKNYVTKELIWNYFLCALLPEFKMTCQPQSFFSLFFCVHRFHSSEGLLEVYYLTPFIFSLLKVQLIYMRLQASPVIVITLTKKLVINIIQPWFECGRSLIQPKQAKRGYDSRFLSHEKGIQSFLTREHVCELEDLTLLLLESRYRF